MIEHEVETTGKRVSPVPDDKAIEVSPSKRTGYLTLVKVLFTQYPKRSVLGASLMITQSFLYNAIFFTCTLVLTKFYGISASSAPYFLIAFAVGNLVGGLVIGRHFDTIGRKRDDFRYVHPVGYSAGLYRLPVRPGRPQRPHADAGLVCDLLLRLSRGQRRLSDG